MATSIWFDADTTTERVAVEIGPWRPEVNRRSMSAVQPELR